MNFCHQTIIISSDIINPVTIYLSRVLRCIRLGLFQKRGRAMLLMIILSFVLTGLVRQYALARHVLDIPNVRSSHSLPTPRGGGVGFVGIFLLYCLYLNLSSQLAFWDMLGIVVPCFLVACLGFIDDHRSIAAKWRLLGHFVAAAFALYCFGGMKTLIPFEWDQRILTVLTSIFAMFYLVWFLNLYNFMDGINGLASVEAICICLGGLLLDTDLGFVSFENLLRLLASLVAGFLCWNFPKARIFMGDVGSGFLGILIGIFSIKAANFSPDCFWSWLILSAVFIVDATVTLIRRMLSGCAIDEPHRQHAYQQAADLFASHAKVTLGVLVINLVWLFPIAILVASHHVMGPIGLLIAYVPLIILVCLLQSG
jgi:Fuc2NAc and GlcNAc transferase